MKVYAILAVALMFGSLFAGFAMAQTAQEAKPSSVIGVDAVVKAPSAGRANGNAVASAKRISPSAVATKAVSAESVVRATPAIAPVKVEEAQRAVSVKAQTEFPGKKEFGFAVATSGPGNAVNAQGITKQIQLVLVSQDYVDEDGSAHVTVEEGTLVVVDETYGLRLEQVRANVKTYSVIRAGVAVGQLEAKQTESNKIAGSLNIDGEAYEVEVLTEENPVRLDASSEAQVEAKQSRFVERVRSFFSNLFSFGRA